MKEMDLEGQRLDSLVEAGPPPADSVVGSSEPSPIIERAGENFAVLKGRTLFGTLEIEGDDTYYCFYIQKKTTKTWVLTTRDIFELQAKEDRNAAVVAVLRSFNSGKLEGFGKTFLLTRLMTNLSTMVYLCVQSNNIDSAFMMKAEYTQASTGAFISFTATRGGGIYLKLDLAYEGFKLSLDVYDRTLPFSIPKLVSVQDNKNKAAIVANLGIKTAATLFRTMGERLDWYKRKNYVLIDSDEKFNEMMLNFLKDVQEAANNHKAVLVGLDTETTGLNMYDLSPQNPLRDSVVSIPFSWRDNEGYVICTDMYYFSNVEDESVYPLFTALHGATLRF